MPKNTELVIKKKYKLYTNDFDLYFYIWERLDLMHVRIKLQKKDNGSNLEYERVQYNHFVFVKYIKIKLNHKGFTQFCCCIFHKVYLQGRKIKKGDSREKFMPLLDSKSQKDSREQQ